MPAGLLRQYNLEVDFALAQYKQRKLFKYLLYSCNNVILSSAKSSAIVAQLRLRGLIFLLYKSLLWLEIK